MFSLRTLLFSVVIAAAYIAAFVNRSEVWAGVSVSVARVLLGYGLFAIYMFPERRAFFVPAVMIGVLYSSVALMRPLGLNASLVTTRRCLNCGIRLIAQWIFVNATTRALNPTFRQRARIFNLDHAATDLYYVEPRRRISCVATNWSLYHRCGSGGHCWLSWFLRRKATRFEGEAEPMFSLYAVRCDGDCGDCIAGLVQRTPLWANIVVTLTLCLEAMASLQSTCLQANAHSLSPPLSLDVCMARQHTATTITGYGWPIVCGGIRTTSVGR